MTAMLTPPREIAHHAAWARGECSGGDYRPGSYHSLACDTATMAVMARDLENKDAEARAERPLQGEALLVEALEEAATAKGNVVTNGDVCRPCGLPVELCAQRQVDHGNVGGPYECQGSRWRRLITAYRTSKPTPTAGLPAPCGGCGGFLVCITCNPHLARSTPRHATCDDCGPHVAFDEDGCCAQCGAAVCDEPCNCAPTPTREAVTARRAERDSLPCPATTGPAKTPERKKP